MLCGQLPLNINLNNNVTMTLMSLEQPDSPVRTGQSIFSPEYGQLKTFTSCVTIYPSLLL